MAPCLFEVGPNGEDFVDKVLDGKDVVFSEYLLDHLVVGEGHSLFVDLSVTTLVDELADSLEVGFTVIESQAAACHWEVDLPIGDKRLDEFKHLFSGLVDLDEYTVVDLQKPKELQDFPGFGSNLVDTARREGLGELLRIASHEVIRTL